MHNCTQTTSNHILLPSNNLNTLKCGQLHSTTSNHANQVLFDSNNLQYPQKCTNALNQFKSPFKCVKYTFKHYKHSNQHLQPPNVHLYTSNVVQGALQHKVCLIFICIVREKEVQSIISRHRDSRPPSIFNCKSMIRGVESNDDLHFCGVNCFKYNSHLNFGNP